MKNLIGVFLLFVLLPLNTLHAATQKYTQETEISTSPQAKFTISAGWSFDEESKKLTSPEGDVIAYLLERKAEKDLDNLARQEWLKIDPEFSYPILDSLSLPLTDAWEEIRQIVYKIPVEKNRTVFSVVQVFKGTAYILLVNATNAGLDKRVAQLQIAASTWQPLGFPKEDLSKNKIKIFSHKDAREMDKFIATAMKELQIPGVSLAIVQNGQEVYQQALGVKKAGGHDRVTPKTLFMIGSTTKPLTTLMLAKLVEQGKLSWETPIHEVLPAFSLPDQQFLNQLQIKHTACACTGLPRRDMEFIFGSLVKSPEDLLGQFQDIKPTTTFGETFQYSNYLVAVGGFAGANIYGKGNDLFSKYENAMNDLVFTPLSMKASRIKPQAADLPNLASPHARDLDGKMVAFPQTIDDMVYPVAPAGAIWSNVQDLTKYLLMELRLGKSADGKQLFAKEQIMRRRTPGIKIAENMTYGLGLVLEKYKGIALIGHDGGTMGFTHSLFFFPEYDVGVVIQANAGGMGSLNQAVKEKILEILLGAQAKATDTLQLSKISYQQRKQQEKERISRKPQDTQWIKDYMGTYTNKALGQVTITTQKANFILTTPRWSSMIAAAQEDKGEKLLALSSPPWLGIIELRVSHEGARKLILNDAQNIYEFNEVK